MKIFLKTSAAILTACVLLAGCVGTPPAPDSDTGHPANPRAAASPVPPLNIGLFGSAEASKAVPAKTETPHAHHHE